MSIGQLALGLYLLFVGAAQLGWFSVSATVLGICALVAGIVILLDALGVIGDVNWRRTRA